jgi:hypothetical protein
MLAEARRAIEATNGNTLLDQTIAVDFGLAQPLPASQATEVDVGSSVVPKVQHLKKMTPPNLMARHHCPAHIRGL